MDDLGQVILGLVIRRILLGMDYLRIIQYSQQWLTKIYFLISEAPGLDLFESRWTKLCFLISGEVGGETYPFQNEERPYHLPNH